MKRLLNTCMSEGSIPEDWRIRTVTEYCMSINLNKVQGPLMCNGHVLFCGATGNSWLAWKCGIIFYRTFPLFVRSSIIWPVRHFGRDKYQQKLNVSFSKVYSTISWIAWWSHLANVLQASIHGDTTVRYRREEGKINYMITTRKNVFSCYKVLNRHIMASHGRRGKCDLGLSPTPSK